MGTNMTEFWNMPIEIQIFVAIIVITICFMVMAKLSEYGE